MQSLKKYAKDRGVLVFAFNTPTVDYVSIADRTSVLTAKNLNLPITLVTDSASTPKFKYDSVIRVDNDNENFRSNLDGTTVAWKNFGRYLAYELSPYHETLLIDTDYLVTSDNLLKLFETDFDYKLMHHNKTDDGPSYELMGETSINFVWATIILFRKSKKSEMLFNLVSKIQRNYNYYRALYNVREGNYRNDYAFAMANNILSGYSNNSDDGIPWNMVTVDKKIDNIEIVGSLLRIQQHNTRTIFYPTVDLHIMDKDYLQSENFAKLIGELNAA